MQWQMARRSLGIGEVIISALPLKVKRPPNPRVSCSPAAESREHSDWHGGLRREPGHLKTLLLSHVPVGVRKWDLRTSFVPVTHTPGPLPFCELACCAVALHRESKVHSLTEVTQPVG